MSTQTQTSIDEYKHEEYVHLGFTEEQATQLVETPHLSVATIRIVLNKGCTTDLAFRIFHS